MSMREGTRRKKISVLHMLGSWEGKIEGCNCPSCKEWDAGEKKIMTANKSPPKSPKGSKKASVKVKTIKRDVAKNNKESNTMMNSNTEEPLDESEERLICDNKSEDFDSPDNIKGSSGNHDGNNKQPKSKPCRPTEVERDPNEKKQHDDDNRLSCKEPTVSGTKVKRPDKEERKKGSDIENNNPVFVQKTTHDESVIWIADPVDSLNVKQEPEEYFSDEEVIEKTVKRKPNSYSVRESRTSKRAKMVTSEIENVYAKPRMIFTGRGVVRKFEPGLDRTPKFKRGKKPGKAAAPVKIKQEPKNGAGSENECEEEEGSDLDQLQKALSEAAENISDVGEEFFDAFHEFGEDPKKCGRPKRKSNTLFKRVENDGDKYVECNMCFKMLKESSMKQHYKTHSGEKPHTCSECDARFTRKGDVERHKRLVHKNQKPYKCQKCNREYSDRKNLKAHLQNHDKAIYYACNTCGFKFGKREYYENHIRYIHPLPDGSVPAFTENEEDLATKQLKQIEMEERRERHSDSLTISENSEVLTQDEDEESEASEKAMEITVSMSDEPNAASNSNNTGLVKEEHENITSLSSQDEELIDHSMSPDSEKGEEVAACSSKPEVGTDVKVSKGTLSFTQTVPDTDSQDEDLVDKVIAAAVSQATNTIESLQAKSGGNMSGNDVDLDEEEEEDEMLDDNDPLQDILDSTTYDMLPITQVQKQTEQPTEVHINASVRGQQRKFIIQVPPGANLNVQTIEGMEMIVSIVNQLCAGKGELDGPIEVTMHNPNNKMCSVVYGFIHRPLSGREDLPQVVWVNIARHAFVQTCLNLLWLYGLTHVGPVRAVLLSEHADIVVLAVWSAVLKGSGGPGKLRGSFWFVLGVLSLVLFDNDNTRTTEHPEGHQHHGISHVLYYLLGWTGLSDHEGGVVVLLLTVCLQAYVNNGGRRLAVDVGGSKRLQALTAIVSVGFLVPLALLVWFTQESPSPRILNFIPQAFIVALFAFVLHRLCYSTCVQKLDVVRTARIGTLSIFLMALFFNSVWRYSSEVDGDDETTKDNFEHAFSGGVAFSLIMFSAATLQLTSSKERWHSLGSGLGILPIHGLSRDSLHTQHSIPALVTSTLSLILADRNSRTIFYFLCVNLCFTFVEFAYGMWTNSLGLISDGFHMLFDCSALVMGLVASVMARWKPTKTFPYGYGRIEVLSGFVNGLFLTVIGLMILYEALGRLLEPPEVHTERLLAVAVCGLIINMFGVVSFSHTHSHGHSSEVSHSHSCNTQQGSHGHSHNINTNMQGVFLHILADTLGSVAVIISSVLIEWYGWLVADPLCSLILSILILASVIPLLSASASILLLRVPQNIEVAAKKCIEKILEAEYVLSCKDPRFWQHSGETFVATVTVQCKPDATEQRIIHIVTGILQEAGFSLVTVEVEVLSNNDIVCAIPPSQWGLGTIVKEKQNPHPNSIRAV
ncbi:hypothetical protein Pmani_022831 [Petrolisthes manimaculis]|uniref:Proton-coupled zinc antiporter SLC30A5 n=1 Tax=Petrolisthes manimaculis TaxID=1843537 RepID=A0AAE1PDQ8_9EUCA|nr:hypothetical protein Pmani_022831 [Petrolisthes manimaculis]